MFDNVFGLSPYSFMMKFLALALAFLMAAGKQFFSTLQLLHTAYKCKEQTNDKHLHAKMTLQDVKLMHHQTLMSTPGLPL